MASAYPKVIVESNGVTVSFEWFLLAYEQRAPLEPLNVTWARAVAMQDAAVRPVASQGTGVAVSFGR